jgi:hypothetical protein
MSDQKRPPEGPEGRTPDAVLDGLDADALWRDSPEAIHQRAGAKRTLLEGSLEKGKTQIRVDARRAGVRVPEHLAGEFQLALNLSWRFAHTGMEINERGVAATLRFGGVPHRCQLPWSAVWGIAPVDDDKLRVWPADLPPELGGPPRAEHESEPPPVEPVRPRLSMVPLEAPPALAPATPEIAPEPAADAPAEPPAEPPTDRPKAPWLRVVK